MHKLLSVIAVSGAFALLGTTGAIAAPNPSGQGLPGQSCHDIVANGGTEPGQASSSPGSPFNEPAPDGTGGGTGGAHYNETSQYDVACFQVSQPPK